jgi:hypothetical protein
MAKENVVYTYIEVAIDIYNQQYLRVERNEILLFSTTSMELEEDPEK